MGEILHQLIDGLSVYPIIFRVSTIQVGAGVLPSTVWGMIRHTKKRSATSPITGATFNFHSHP